MVKQPQPLDRFFFPVPDLEAEWLSIVFGFRADDVLTVVIFFVRS